MTRARIGVVGGEMNSEVNTVDRIENKMKVLILTIWVSVAGCSGSVESRVHAPVSKNAFRTAYVIDNGYSTVVGYNVMPMPGSVLMTDGEKSKKESIGNTALHIKKALQNYGIRTAIGNASSVLPNVDLVVRFEDEWQWDLKMYLKRLKISFYNARTRQLIVTGGYKPGGAVVHDFPTSEREVPNVISSKMSKL
ncbi:MAG: hypothetical protein GY854_31105 [Deltaproteobacteria bacterium]|nr:hypothetical protein [Deltaproteobacteria bacterium]